MLLVAPVRGGLRIDDDRRTAAVCSGIEKLNVPKRSTLPAITHVDYSARIQTVHEDTNPRYYTL